MARALRTLIVEDSSAFREIFKESLHLHFPSLVIGEAGTAEEGLLKITKGSPPDLMFVDIRLPGANGLQLIQKVKKDFPEIRIAMMTAYDFPEYERAAKQYGADRFFVKGTFGWHETEEFISGGKS